MPSLVQAGLIAGFEEWGITQPFAASLTDGAAASYTFAQTGSPAGTSTINIIAIAASTDGTFGSLAMPSADDTNNAANDGIYLANGASGFFLFTVTDTTGVARKLTTFHFDTAVVRPNAAKTWTLSVDSGDLTAGIVASDTAANIAGGTADWYDYDVDLTGLADHTLDAFGTVVFQLAFAQTSASTSVGGHHQYLDNVGISAAAEIPEPTSLALLGLVAGGWLVRKSRAVR